VSERGKGGRSDPNNKGTGTKVVVKKKKKQPPIPVPSFDAAFDKLNPPVKQKPKPDLWVDVGPGPSRRPKPKPQPHLPTEFEYMASDDYAAWLLGKQTAADKRRIQEYNQRREREQRASLKRERDELRADRNKRRAAVRAMDKKTRSAVGSKTLQDFIMNGPKEPGFSVGGFLKGVGQVGHAIGESVRDDPMQIAKGIYSAADWYLSAKPGEALAGKHTKGKGYEGGLAGAWDAMSTEEQIDTILGGKSLANVLQGENLSPGNIGRAIALAALAPIPWGKGLPSLASVLLRGGMSAAEVKVALTTGKGLREGLALTKTPVRPIARARRALAPTAARPTLLRPLHPNDTAAVAAWDPDAARVGAKVIAASDMMDTVALPGPAGSLRGVASWVVQGDKLIVNDLAAAGKGGGRAMMKELAGIAADKKVGVALTDEGTNLKSHDFYTKIGMKQEGKRGFTWTAKEAADFADAPDPFVEAIPKPRILTPDEAATLEPTEGLWYHGTTQAFGDEIMASGVMKAGNRRQQMGRDAVWFSANPQHAAQFGDTIIEVPEALIPAGAERVSAFGGMIASPVDVPLGVPEAAVPEGQLFDITPAEAVDPKYIKEQEAAFKKAMGDDAIEAVIETLPPEIRQASMDIASQMIAKGANLPPEIQDASALARAIDRTFARARIGEDEGRFWYQHAAQVVRALTDEFAQHPNVLSGEVEPLTIDQVTQLYAIFSQATNTVANITFLRKGAKQFMEHGDVFTGMFGTSQGPEALAVMRGVPWEGRKRSTFYMNIIEDVDPEAFALADGVKDGVTVDRWVVRMFAPESGKVTPDQYYDSIEEIIQRMGATLGWKPKEVQAAAWVQIKGFSLPEKGPLVKAGAGDAGEYGLKTGESTLFNVETAHPQTLRDQNEIKMAHSMDFEMTDGTAGLGNDLTLEQKRALAIAMEPDLRRLVESTPGVKLLSISHSHGGWSQGVNVETKVLVSGTVAAKRKLGTRIAKAFDQHLVQASRIGSGKNAAAALVLNSPAFKNPQVTLAFWKRLVELEPSLQGFTSGTRRGRPSIVSRTEHQAIDLEDYRRAVDNAAQDVGISVQLEKQDLELLISSQFGKATTSDVYPGANYAGDTQAARIRGRLKKNIEKASNGELPVEQAATPVELQPHIPPTSDQTNYDRFLDNVVRASGKGKKGVTREMRESAEEETLKYAERYPEDDPLFEEFWRLREAAHPQSADDIPDEWGGLSLGGFRRGPVPTRTLTLNDLEQQIPGAARSSLSRLVFNRPADWVSTKIMSEDSKAAEMIRRMFPTGSTIRPNITAEARVSRAAGMERAQEALRTQADAADHLNALPKQDSVEDQAHAYWAQLPESHRNAEGLQLILAKQAEALEEITSGRAQAGIEEMLAAKENQYLRMLLHDLPIRADDISVSMVRLQKIIADPPKYKPEIIDAMRALAEDRKAILVEAELLDPERAVAREGIVSNWLGLEPTGEEVFLGHRLGKVRSANESLMAVSVGTGRVRIPQGVAHENKLVLLTTGRMHASTHVAAEDWQAAQVYRNTLIDRDKLGLMGRAPTSMRVPPGHRLMNPKGRPYPAYWKSDMLAKLDVEDEEAVHNAAQEMVAGFLAKAGEEDAMFAAAGDMWPELRIVPDAVVNRYFGQFTPVRGVTKGGRLYDAAVDFVSFSIVFGRVGYIPKNILQNLIMSVPNQGPFMLVNIPRAMQVLRDPKLRHLLQAEIGHGASVDVAAGSRVRGIPSWMAGKVGRIADDPLRIASFLHEAAAAGVISKYKPTLGDADAAALLHLLRDKSQEGRWLLNDIKSRAVEPMGNFGRMNPQQRRWARRFLIIPGWLWAGTRLPIHFAATHPGRSAAIAYVAAGEPYADRAGLPQNRPITDLFEDGLPYNMEGLSTPWGTLRTTSLSPVNTPWDLLHAILGMDGRSALDSANPALKSGIYLAGKQMPTPTGSYRADSYWESFKANALRLVPNWKFTEEMINPDGSGIYPQDASRLRRLMREAGVFPLEILGVDDSDDAKWLKEAEALAGKMPPEKRATVLALREVNRAYSDTYTKYKKDNKIVGSFHPQETLAVLFLTYATMHPESADAMKRAAASAATMTDEQANDEITKGREKMGLTAYGQLERALRKAAEDARTPSGMANAGQH
jgi:hypothetical protein